MSNPESVWKAKTNVEVLSFNLFPPVEFDSVEFFPILVLIS